MSEVWAAGLARGGTQSAKRELAATLRVNWNDGSDAAAILTAYGEVLYDFIILMVGPGEVAEHVLTDTVIAATGLARWLRDDDMLLAWLFALARHACRRYPPVVWREQQWEGMRSLAVNGPVGQGSAVPVGVVRMAVLGLAPLDREVMVLSSTRCKLLSTDLAAILRISREDAVQAVTTAHRRFEQALAICAKEIGFQRDPHVRAPEIGEMVGMVLSGLHRPLPFGWIVHAAAAPEGVAYRHEVLSRIWLSNLDGFPEQPRSDPRPRNDARGQGEQVQSAVPRGTPDAIGHRSWRVPAAARREMAPRNWGRPAGMVPG
jgi:DNA-directed RNA polymerase specialized sigma24 family protein